MIKGDFMDEIEINIENGKNFICNRITELRIKANISEYQMSLELGQIAAIFKAFPPARQCLQCRDFLTYAIISA